MLAMEKKGVADGARAGVATTTVLFAVVVVCAVYWSVSGARSGACELGVLRRRRGRRGR